MAEKQVLMTLKIDKPLNAVIYFFAAFCLVGIAWFMTPYMVAAAFSYFLMVAGLVYRRQKDIHYKLMSSSIGLDLLIVLILEVSRDAVATAAGMKLPPLQQAHIFASSLAVLFYFPVVTLGVLRLKGSKSRKVLSSHKALGITAFIFRTLGFILMFSLLKKG
jgi:hypothetical protein